jgi:hypothetical protein
MPGIVTDVVGAYEAQLLVGLDTVLDNIRSTYDNKPCTGIIATDDLNSFLKFLYSLK